MKVNSLLSTVVHFGLKAGTRTSVGMQAMEKFPVVIPTGLTCLTSLQNIHYLEVLMC